MATSWSLVREAGRTVPELADIYTESRHRGRGAQHVIFGAWPDGTLRPDIDLDMACDIYASISNVDTYRMLSDERGLVGRSHPGVVDRRSLSTLLLAAPAGVTDTGVVFIALRSVADGVVATELDETAQRPRMSVVRPADLPAWVAEREGERPRWVWNDTARWYPPLLAAGTRVDRALDLRLCRRILRSSTSTAATDLGVRAPG